MSAPLATLPRLVRFIATRDGGDDAMCPHCEARGRWIHVFNTADGRTIGAMSGCMKLFPQSPVIAEDMRLRGKQERYAKEGWKLPSWDQRQLDVIEAFYSGAITEDAAMLAINGAKRAAAAWRQARGR